MLKPEVKISDLFHEMKEHDLNVKLVLGDKNSDKLISDPNFNRPGLTLAGFYDFFAYDRVQLFGMGEITYMAKMSSSKREDVYRKFFSYDIPCCIFLYSEEPDEDFLKYAREKGVVIFSVEGSTTEKIGRFNYLMDNLFAPTTSKHATFVDIFGVGVMLTGDSGVGKSECALELVERGHRLVADDMVNIKKVNRSYLLGTGSPLLKHHMEIRGLGILNIREIYGTSSISVDKTIDLVVHLEDWNAEKTYDRLGLDDVICEILELEIPFITIPVRPGRNIPIIVETAALNQRLKKMGINSARELDNRIQASLKD